MTLPSYSEIQTVGHKLVGSILPGPVVVQEKVDGSQFSFGMVPDSQYFPEFQCRSKGQDKTHVDPTDMFSVVVAAVRSLDLHFGWIYRGEFLAKPHHNALAYNRVPQHHVILFDIEVSPGNMLSPTEVKQEAVRLGLECVPTFFEGMLYPHELEPLLTSWLQQQSILGGQLIEGVVIKNYNLFTPDHKVMMAKYVSDRFKEVHRKTWGESNPSQHDIVRRIIEQYRTEARWEKAIQHLRDDGQLTETPKDIGPILREINADVLKEEEDTIKAELFKYFWKDIARGITAGFPDFYKNRLLENFTDPMASYTVPELVQLTQGIQGMPGISLDIETDTSEVVHDES